MRGAGEQGRKSPLWISLKNVKDEKRMRMKGRMIYHLCFICQIMLLCLKPHRCSSIRTISYYSGLQGFAFLALKSGWSWLGWLLPVLGSAWHVVCPMYDLLISFPGKTEHVHDSFMLIKWLGHTIARSVLNSHTHTHPLSSDFLWHCPLPK